MKTLQEDYQKFVKFSEVIHDKLREFIKYIKEHNLESKNLSSYNEWTINYTSTEFYEDGISLGIDIHTGYGGYEDLFFRLPLSVLDENGIENYVNNLNNAYNEKIQLKKEKEEQEKLKNEASKLENEKKLYEKLKQKFESNEKTIKRIK